MFDSTTRNRLAAFVSDARRLLCGDYNKPGGEITSLLQTYGIQPDGTVADLDTLPGLDQRGYELASTLRDVLDHKRANAVGLKAWGKYDPHVYDLIQEQAFTVLNRLCALRMAEERGILPTPVISQGPNSDGFELYEMVADKKHLSRDERYEAFLFSVFDELSLDLGVLFDRFSPHGMLFPRSDALGELLEEINHSDLAPLWEADETIGWIYQYWNSKEERKAMRDASAAPRNSRELAVRNQFFTPRYVVEFLTDNTLGRIWYEMTQGQTRLKDECKYLVRRPDEVFLGHMTRPCDDAEEGVLQAVNDLCEGTEQSYPEYDSSDCQRMIDLCHTVNGYARLPDGEAREKWYQEARERVERDPSAIGTQDLLDFLFHECRQDRHGGDGSVYSEPWFVAACNEVRARALHSRESDLPQEELLKQPVFIPHRPVKDPREIRLLDPACGSMHFGLYAFDLFEAIYMEAWQSNESFREQFPECWIKAESISIRDWDSVTCFAMGDQLNRETAMLAVHSLGDPYDLTGRFHVYSPRKVEEQSGLVYTRPLAEVGWSDFLKEGWVTARAFRENRPEYITCEEFSEEEAFANFRRLIPRLIIEHNIHGVDIDSRAVQIAGLSLWLRAQKTWRDTPASQRPRVRRSNIVCAEPMPGSDAMLEDFVQTLDPPLLGELVQTVFDKMQIAGEAGTLLKIEEEIRTAIDDAKEKWENSQEELPGLGGEATSDLRFLTSDFWNSAEERIYAALRDYAESAEAGDYQRRLFAEDAAHGFAFIDLCRQHYDAVVMNPPFGDFPKGLKSIKKTWYPITWHDIFAAFTDRLHERLTENGLLGAITSRTGFFLPSLASWREDFLMRFGNPCILADLGGDVMDDAMVESAAYILAKHTRERRAPFFRLLGTPNREVQLHDSINNHNGGLASKPLFLVDRQSFRRLSKSPFVYWVSEGTFKKFEGLPKLVPDIAEARQGLVTGDSDRFVRLFWEVDQLAVETSGNTDRSSAKWFPYVMRGSSQPWFSPLTVVVKWENSGHELRHFFDKKGALRSRPRAMEFYFRPGFSWTRRAVRFVPYVIPAGCIPSASRYMAFPPTDKVLEILAVTASNTVSAALRFYGEMFCRPNYLADHLKSLPWATINPKNEQALGARAAEEIKARRLAYSAEEPFQEFVLPTALRRDVNPAALTYFSDSLIGPDLDDAVAIDYGLTKAEQADLQRDLDEAIASQSSLNTEDSADSDEDCLLVDDTPYARQETTASYLIGAAFGRWDIRYATGERQPPELPDPFDPLPVCPPGMLQNADGLPAAKEDIPDDYPLPINWPGILVSDPGHPEDIVARVRDALAVIWDDRSTAIEQEACEALGLLSLRSYFGRFQKGKIKGQPVKGFFEAHLDRYTKSKRSAPIYWSLSTESGTYTLWIYYHRLTEDTLYACITNFVGPKQEQAEKTLVRLAAKGDARTAAEDKEYEQTETLIGELATFRAELERLAKIWKPNLNDGVQITAAPLWNLFRLKPWQKKLKDTWDKLEAGDYDWAHLAHTLWPERVIPKCATDRSLAIAHGYEEDLWKEVKNDKGKLVWQPKVDAEEIVKKLIRARH